MQLEEKSVIVCGGLGFLGSSIIRTFLKQPQWKIYIVDRLREGERYPYYVSGSRVIPINCSLDDKNILIDQLPNKCDVILNCVEPFDDADCIEQAGEFISIENIKEEQEILQREMQVLDNLEWLGKQIEVKQYVFPICYQNKLLRDKLKTEIQRRREKSIIIYLPVLFGIFDRITSFGPYLILKHLLGKKQVNNQSCMQTQYEWLYVDDAATQIREIVCMTASGNYIVEGERYTAVEINSMILTDAMNITYRSPIIELQNRNDEHLEEHADYVEIFEYQCYEDIRERLMQTFEFYEDNVNYYQSKLKKGIGVEEHVD